jgi:ubiquinol-cytochrome c reductase cytochrome b subunit
MNIDKLIQKSLKTFLPLKDDLPTEMPAYVNSCGYFFGTMTLSTLGLVFISGIVLAFFGPDWWHFSSVGKFFNAMHFWSVQVFYLAVILHITFKFFIAAWRGNRFHTWVNGWIIFIITIFSGISGTLLQANWDAQWNSQQGKTAFSALGLSWMNWMNYTTVLTLHVVFFAGLIAFFVLTHLGFVRHESPVHPIVNEQKGDIDDRNVVGSNDGGQK